MLRNRKLSEHKQFRLEVKDRTRKVLWRSGDTSSRSAEAVGNPVDLLCNQVICCGIC